MPNRIRQFSQIRSQSISLSMSELSESRSIIQKLHLQLTTPKKSQCFNCINKTLVLSKKEKIQAQAQIEKKEYIQNFKKINALKDYQKEHRDRLLLQASRYNKSLAESQRLSFQNLKRSEDLKFKEQLKRKEQQLLKKDQELRKSQIENKQKYKKELTTQVSQQRFRKELQKSRAKTLIPQVVNNLKVLEQSEKYYHAMKEERNKCQKQNKRIMLKRSYQKTQEKQRNIRQEKKHIESIEKQISKFTEYQMVNSNSYQASRLMLSQAENPENVFTQLKRIQTEKNLSRVVQRKQKNKQRMLELKKQEEQNRLFMQKKLSSIKNYVQELTQQVLEKKQRKAKQTQYKNFYQPEKSRADYFTEQLQKKVQPCNSCQKPYEQRFLGTS